MVMDKGECVAFLHPYCCQKEWQDYQRGAVPSHRLWGQVELEKLGFKTLLCPPVPGFLARLGNRGWFLWQTAWLWKNRRKIHAAFAVHEVSALLVLVIRAFFRFSKPWPVPLIILNFGLLHPKNSVGWRLWIWRKVLKAADLIISLVERQIPEIESQFGVPKRLQVYIPLGIDSAFVKRSAENFGAGTAEQDRFILSVGTNEGKDYATLLEALPLGERLVIVTDDYNARLIRAHRCFGSGVEVHQKVPIQKLRGFYQAASVMVIPLHDTAYGSGHTVFLENLALGKVLIVSQSRGMEGYARDGENCLTVPVGDTQRLRNAIQSVMNNPQGYAHTGMAASRDAEQRFAIGRFAADMAGVLEQMLRRSQPATGHDFPGMEGANLEGGGKHASV